MSEQPKAAFSLVNFKITRFSFFENDSDNNVSIEFKPSGIFFEDNGIFVESIEFSAFLESNKSKPIVNVNFEATFQFKNVSDLSEIPSYFYLNSIAIIFPYLRAFITNMTLQANIKPMILPLLNLTGLEKPLRENTTVADKI